MFCVFQLGNDASLGHRVVLGFQCLALTRGRKEKKRHFHFQGADRRNGARAYRDDVAKKEREECAAGKKRVPDRS